MLMNACMSHLIFVRGMGWKGRLCFWLGILNPCLGLCTCLGRELGFGLGLAYDGKWMTTKEGLISWVSLVSMGGWGGLG